MLTAQIKKSLAAAENRKAADEKKRVNQLASGAGAKPEEGALCVICGKKGHWAVDKHGKDTTCSTCTKDAVEKDKTLKEKADEAKQVRQDVRNYWKEKSKKSGRPGGG